MFADAAARHRLLEGFLLRLARGPDPDAFVLRGGMLVRQWFRPLGRPALDVDLVCRLPYDIADLRSRLASILAGSGVSDGTRFDADRVRLDPIWPDSRIPGLRLFAVGEVDGWPTDIQVDLTFGLTVWPDPQRVVFRAERGSEALWACRPQTLIGRKLQVLTELGHRHWRPKDLNDIRLLLARFDPDRATLGQAIEASLIGYAESFDQVRGAFAASSWWSGPRADVRWHRYCRQCPGFDVPSRLQGVVDEVADRLGPVLG